MAIAGDVAQCAIRTTLVEEADLGSRVAAMFVFEAGVIAVAYDPRVVRGYDLPFLRLWWRRQVAVGWACRILLTSDLPSRN